MERKKESAIDPEKTSPMERKKSERGPQEKNPLMRLLTGPEVILTVSPTAVIVYMENIGFVYPACL
jgi:hypothetical protein